MLTQLAVRHRDQGELLRAASVLVSACLSAQNVPADETNEWLTQRQLLELEPIVARLRAGLEALVPEDSWLFDRPLHGPDAD